MKKIIFLPLIFVLFIACSDDDATQNYSIDSDLFIREDAENTVIPLVLDKTWNYKITPGSEGNPDKLIKNILQNDQITDVTLLPIRKYDNNDGTGKYEYQALCYITTNQLVYFYMNDKIYVGRYLESDSYGNPSAIWDFELPTRCEQNSDRYFLLNRNASTSNPNLDEDYLHELAGWHDIDVELDLPNVKRYTNCKLFQYYDHRASASDPIRLNKFYFKEGVGLIRYQKYLEGTDSTYRLYEQNLVEQN